MTKEELKKVLEENKAMALEILNVKGGITFADFKDFAESDNQAKKYIQSEIDRAVTKGIDTWKERNLQAEVDKKVSELYPAETEEQKELKKLRSEMETLKREKKREELKNIALRKLNERGLPQSLLSHLNIRDDEDVETIIDDFTSTLDGVVNEKVKGELKKYKRTDVERGERGEDVENPYKVNPWDEKTFNLTLQGKIKRENSELARYLETIARKN